MKKLYIALLIIFGISSLITSASVNTDSYEDKLSSDEATIRSGEILHVTSINLIAKNEMEYGKLYINNVLMENEDTVIFPFTFLPLRTIFEALGATVTWNEEDETIDIVWNERALHCYFSQSGNPDITFFAVFDVNSGKNIYLNPMGFSGFYVMINNRTYLGTQTCEYLFSALNISIDINSDKKEVYINS